jgi:hypothetical protein
MLTGRAREVIECFKDGCNDFERHPEEIIAFFDRL